MRLLQALHWWVGEEIRLLGLESWGGGAYDGSPTKPGPKPFTRKHPDCRKVEIRQRKTALVLRRRIAEPRVPIGSAITAPSAFGFLRRDV